MLGRTLHAGEPVRAEEEVDRAKAGANAIEKEAAKVEKGLLVGEEDHHRITIEFVLPAGPEDIGTRTVPKSNQVRLSGPQGETEAVKCNSVSMKAVI